MASETTGAGASKRSTRGGDDRAETKTGGADDLQAQIEAVKADLAAISNTLADLVRTSVREGRVRMESKAREYREKSAEQADAAWDEARAYGEALEERIVKNPLTAVLVALGLGFLIGLLSRR